jgi:hypothetical protein
MYSSPGIQRRVHATYAPATGGSVPERDADGAGASQRADRACHDRLGREAARQVVRHGLPRDAERLVAPGKPAHLRKVLEELRRTDHVARVGERAQHAVHGGQRGERAKGPRRLGRLHPRAGIEHPERSQVARTALPLPQRVHPRHHPRHEHVAGHRVVRDADRRRIAEALEHLNQPGFARRGKELCGDPGADLEGRQAASLLRQSARTKPPELLIAVEFPEKVRPLERCALRVELGERIDGIRAGHAGAGWFGGGEEFRCGRQRFRRGACGRGHPAEAKFPPHRRDAQHQHHPCGDGGRPRGGGADAPAREPRVRGQLRARAWQEAKQSVRARGTVRGMHRHVRDPRALRARDAELRSHGEAGERVTALRARGPSAEDPPDGQAKEQVAHDECTQAERAQHGNDGPGDVGVRRHPTGHGLRDAHLGHEDAGEHRRVDQEAHRAAPRAGGRVAHEDPALVVGERVELGECPVDGARDQSHGAGLVAAEAPRAGLEPSTCRLEGGCSIQLSYRGGRPKSSGARNRIELRPNSAGGSADVLTLLPSREGEAETRKDGRKGR